MLLTLAHMFGPFRPLESPLLGTGQGDFGLGHPKLPGPRAASTFLSINSHVCHSGPEPALES